MLEYFFKRQNRNSQRTLVNLAIWGGILYVFTFKGRRGFQYHVHDAYMSPDESSVKRHGQSVEYSMQHAYANAPVNMDHSDYERMVTSLHLEDVPSRPHA